MLCFCLTVCPYNSLLVAAPRLLLALRRCGGTVFHCRFHLCLDIQANDNPLDPLETQALLKVAHFIREEFEDWKERFCVLKAMIKLLAQVQNAEGRNCVSLRCAAWCNVYSCTA